MLTKTDINTMKKADKILFRKDGIECIKKQKGTHFEERHFINCETNLKNGEKAFYSWYDDALRMTILEFLKVSDELNLYWYKDASTNQLLENANLHGDNLYLKIWRETKKGKKLYKFLIDTQTSLNNTARMIYA